MKIRSVGARAVPCRQSDRHDEANSCFSQFCKSILEVSTFVNSNVMQGKTPKKTASLSPWQTLPWHYNALHQRCTDFPNI